MSRYKIGSYQSRKTTEDSLKQETVGEKNGLFDSAILIAVITVIGYYLAYSYKKGYLSYYGVPENVIIQVDIINIIVASTSLLAVLFILVSAYVHLNNLFNELSNPVPHPIVIILKKNVMPLIILWFLLINIISDLTLIWSIGLLVLIIWIYINPIFKYASVHGYKDKLMKFIETGNTNGVMEKLILTLKSKSLNKYILLILATSLLGSVVNLIGMEEAKKERKYIKLEVNDATYIVLDVVGESYLITPYDEKTNSIKSKFAIVEVKSEFDDLLELENMKLKDSLIVEK